MAKGKTRISKLRVNEVSLVDRPANPAARFVLAKRDEESVEEIEKHACSYCGKQGVQKGEMCPECHHISKALEYSAALDVSVESILTDDSLDEATRGSYLTKSIEEYRDSILALVKGSSDATDSTKQEITEMADITKEQVEALTKSLSPEQSKLVEGLIEKAVKERDELISKAQADATEARVTLAKRDRLAKAAVMVGDTGIKAEMIAEALEKCNDDATVSALIGDLLTKYEAAIEAGSVLKELGSERGADTTSAESQLQKSADDIRNASGGKLTDAQAFALAVERNPALYAQIVNGR